MNTEATAFLGRYLTDLQCIQDERRERQPVYRQHRAARSGSKAAKLFPLPPK